MNQLVRSFDVFDTALTRMVGHPSSLFYLQEMCLVREGGWALGGQHFASARIEAERSARRNSRSEEVTLVAIYRELAVAFDLRQDEVEHFMSLELALEEAVLRPVPETLSILEKLRLQGGRALFISDTYFAKTSLMRWLTELGVARADDAIWASSEVGLTKASGNLFREVLHREQVSAESLLHIGDSKHSDVAAPRALGMRSDWFSVAVLTPREKLVERYAAVTAGAASLLAGASRWVRLSVAAEGTTQSTLRSIAAEVAGPVLTAYLLWVFAKARAHGIQRLMFVARDGQVMLRMAKPLADKLSLKFDMKYLFANRQVVNLAGLRVVDGPALDWISEGAASASLAEVLGRVELDAVSLATALEDSRLPLEGVLGEANVPVLREFLVRPDVAARIVELAQNRRELLRDYFKEQGLLDPAPCAVIDIGWKGRVFGSLCEVLGELHAHRHVGFYFGLFSKPHPRPAGRQEAFLFDCSDEVAVGSGHGIVGLPNVLEIFTQADHGQVLGLERRDGGFVPSLRNEKNDVGGTWDVAYFQDCLVAYAEAVAIDTRWWPDGVDLRPMSEHVLRELIVAPSVAEARVMGGFEYVDGQNGAPQPLAQAYRCRDAYAALKSGALPHKSKVWWEPGAVALTSPLVYEVLRIARRLHRLRIATLRRAGRRHRAKRGAHRRPRTLSDLQN